MSFPVASWNWVMALTVLEMRSFRSIASAMNSGAISRDPWQHPPTMEFKFCKQQLGELCFLHCWRYIFGEKLERVMVRFSAYFRCPLAPERDREVIHFQNPSFWWYNAVLQHFPKSLEGCSCPHHDLLAVSFGGWKMWWVGTWSETRLCSWSDIFRNVIHVFWTWQMIPQFFLLLPTWHFWATSFHCRHRLNVCIGLASFYAVCGENQKLVCTHKGLHFPSGNRIVFFSNFRGLFPSMGGPPNKVPFPFSGP